MQLKKMKVGVFTKEEILSVKRSMRNSYTSLSDSLSALEGWFFSQILTGSLSTPPGGLRSNGSCNRKGYYRGGCRRKVGYDLQPYWEWRCTGMIPTSVETIRSSLTGDSYYRIQHSSGLTVYVYPKEGSTSAFTFFPPPTLVLSIRPFR